VNKTYPLLRETKGALVKLVTHQLNDTLLVRGVAAHLTDNILHEGSAFARGLVKQQRQRRTKRAKSEQGKTSEEEEQQQEEARQENELSQRPIQAQPTDVITTMTIRRHHDHHRTTNE